MNQCKKLIVDFVCLPSLDGDIRFADVEKTNESTQSENQSFDKTTFQKNRLLLKLQNLKVRLLLIKGKKKIRQVRPSEVAEQTSDSSEAALARAVSADGYSEAATTEELAQLSQTNQ